MGSSVKLDLAGFRAYRRQCAPLVDEQADRIAAAANGMKQLPEAEYKAVPARESPEGTIALVTTGRDSTTAGYTAVDNMLHNTLAKALGSGGG